MTTEQETALFLEDATIALIEKLQNAVKKPLTFEQVLEYRGELQNLIKSRDSFETKVPQDGEWRALSAKLCEAEQAFVLILSSTKAAIALDTNNTLEQQIPRIIRRLVDRLQAATEASDGEALHEIAEQCRQGELMLASWNIAAGEYRRPTLIAAELQFRGMMGDIHRTLSAASDDDPADDWGKNQN
jgi:hypothetical protein